MNHIVNLRRFYQSLITVFYSDTPYYVFFIFNPIHQHNLLDIVTL
jgi:hypothetical protein